MKLRKGQAALEFLTTYGWAFLVILVMIGALAYFGVLSPTKFVSERCNFGVEMACNKDTAVAVSGDAPVDLVTIKLTNKFGKQITIDDARLNSDYAIGACTAHWEDATATVTDLAGADYVLETQETGNLIFRCATGSALPPGEKVKLDIELDYFVDSSFPKIQNGELFISVN